MEQTGDVADKVHANIALAMARQMAVVAGQVLSMDEMSNLVSELFATPTPHRAPDGSVVVYVVSDAELSKYFRK